MVNQLQANLPVLLCQLPEFGLVYIKQYGAGNLFLAPDRDTLVNSASLPVHDGIAQVTANGFVQYFWKGDLWVLSDAPGAIVYILPGQSPYLDRALQVPRLPPVLRGNDLSTYR
jgi:hypothetical protein